MATSSNSGSDQRLRRNRDRDEGVDVTDESRPFRAEIEEILVNHSSTRFAKVLKGMNRGLTDAEMAKEALAAGEPIRADSNAAVARIVRLTLSDQLVTAPSEAEEQANVFRELVNHRCSPGLLQHVTTRLTQLQAVGPNVKMTPLGAGHLGANGASQREKLGPLCPECNQFHSGECL
jgi:hypothetical protein